MQNLHYLFHKEYYADLDNPQYKAFNNALTQQRFEPGQREIFVTGLKSFVLKTQYPGLLLGLGYPHELGNDAAEKKDCVQLGFSLDYVSGLPVIPGSTVKGVLRSLFKRAEGLKYILAELDKPELKSDQLIEDLFEGDDVYFDAWPITPAKDGKLLALESITPHGNGLTEPNPIRLLKVRPEVAFLFRFRLTDKGQLSADEKLDLFKELLLLTGIGAKTNVGFGALEESMIPGPYKMLVMCETAGASQPAAAPPKAEGFCRECGRPTKQNKAGRYYEFCFDCSQRVGRS